MRATKTQAGHGTQAALTTGSFEMVPVNLAGMANEYVGYMAFDYGANDRSYVGGFDTPTVNGNTVTINVGHRSKVFWIMAADDPTETPLATATANIVRGPTACCWGFGVCVPDASDAVSWCGRTAFATQPSNSGVRTEQKPMVMTEHASGANVTFDVTLDSVTDTEIVLRFNTTRGTAKRWTIASIGSVQTGGGPLDMGDADIDSVSTVSGDVDVLRGMDTAISSASRGHLVASKPSRMMPTWQVPQRSTFEGVANS